MVRRAAALAAVLLAGAARGQEPESEVAGYTPAAPAPTITLAGYVDFGFADAQGDGTSFAPGDTRLPADYGVDPFAPAVNARGDVASTEAGPLLTNGFLPHSVGIGGRPSFLLNTASLDLRYEPAGAPVLVFVRAQGLPRLSARGSESRFLVQQAFGRVAPLPAHELFVSAGRFDPVFGIEYLEREANLRTGVTPSLLARYTTGTPIGLKVFYRVQLAPLWSAVSLNVAASTAAPFVDALQPPEISLSGRPVGSGRLGYELNLPGLQVKLGGSVMAGPRNDQGDPDAGQRAFGGDARLTLAGVSLSGEYVHVDQDGGPAADKRTGAGPQLVPSAFHARGFWATVAYDVALSGGPLRRLTPYARLERRRAWFQGHEAITVARVTAGLRLDPWDTVALKGEYLLNRELAGAPSVDNDVLAASAVFGF